MKITLISPYPDITSLGLRSLSGYLRNHGHRTQLVFLPDPYGDHIQDGVPRYRENSLDEVVSLCSESDLIGITLMTNFYEGAVQITRKLKSKLDIPVIWGGVHPTVRPEESLSHADMICIGEGETALLELAGRMAKGEDYSNISNLWIKKGSEIIRNDLSPPIMDLDECGFPDYSMEDHHVLRGERVVPLDNAILEEFLQHGTVSESLGRTGYQTMTSRGCPYACSYCINDKINKMYGSKGKLRWRSVEHVIEELAWVREHMPYVDYVWISDDEFMARKSEELEKFSRMYKERIGLPFSCLVSPLSVSEEKMAMLVDAGLVYVQMGVESGSARIQELFRRKNMNNSRMKKAIAILNRFKDKIHPPVYDFIIDVPWETTEDKVDSLRFISEIPKPFILQPFTLMLYPGTHLHELAMENGLIRDEKKEIYNRTWVTREHTYLNLLFMAARNGKLPSGLLRLLISTPALAVFNSELMKPVFMNLHPAVRWLRQRLKALKI